MDKFFEKALRLESSVESTFFTLEEVAKLEGANTLTTDDVVQDYVILEGDVALDYETTGFDPLKDEVVGVGFSNGKTHVYLEVTKENYSRVRNHLIEQLDKADTIICHNLKFEYKFTWGFFKLVLPEEKLYDTILIPYHKGFPNKKLSYLAETLLDRYPYNYDELPDYTTGTLAPYCAEDCYECVLLHDLFKTKYIEDKIFQTDLLNIISTAKAELLGVFVPESDVSAFLARLEKEEKSIIEVFEFLTGKEKELLTSPAKKSKYLFEELKLPTEGIKRGKSGAYSVDKDSLKELEGLHPAVDIMVTHGVISKLKSFTKSLLELVEDDLIFPQTNTIQTITGRLSMSSPNLQQSPNPGKYKALGNDLLYELGKGFRQLIKPRKGYAFCVADYPSFEFRILATLSEDDTLLDIFNNGKDFHVTVCEDVFDIKYDYQNPEHKTLRGITKSINYGAAYGMGASKLQRECLKAGLEYDLNKCRDILKQYWSALSKVHSFFIREKISAVINGYSENMYGRKRYYKFRNQDLYNTCCEYEGIDLDYVRDNEIISFWENEIEKKGLHRDDTSYWSQIMNYQLQSTNADVVRRMINQLTEDLMEDKSNLLFTVHDEFIIETHASEITYVKELMKKRLENSIKLLVPLPIHVDVVQSWGDAK